MNDFSHRLVLVLAVCLFGVAGLIFWRMSIPRPLSAHTVIINDNANQE